MKFLNPIGFLSALLLPIIIFLHFKKQQIQEIKISYIGIWEEIIKQESGFKRKNVDKIILLIIQLLIGILLAVILANPILIKNKNKKITIALDTSITMNYERNGITKLDKAKDEIKNYLLSVKDDTLIDLVTLSNNPEIAVKDGSKNEVLDILPNIDSSFEPLSVEKSRNILFNTNSLSIIYTDKDLVLGDENINISFSNDNAGFISGSYDFYNNAALYKIKNYSEESKKITVEIYDDKKTIDVLNIDIPAFSTANAVFKNIDSNTNILTAKINNIDSLAEDNFYKLPIGDKYKIKILLVDNDVYIEKALESIPYVSVEHYSTTVKSYSKKLYDIVICGKEIPNNLNLENCCIWYISTPSEYLGEYSEGKSPIVINDNIFSKDIESSKSYINNYYTITNDDNFETIISAGNQSVMVYKLNSRNKQIYSSINFYDSTFVYQPSFPILVENIVQWFCCSKKSFETGETMYFDDNVLSINTPSNKKYDICDDSYTFNEIGCHEVEYKNGVKKEYLVNPPSSIIVDCDNQNNELLKKENIFSKINIKNWLLCSILILLIVEWEVFKRG